MEKAKPGVVLKAVAEKGRVNLLAREAELPRLFINGLLNHCINHFLVIYKQWEFPRKAKKIENPRTLWV